MPFDLRCSLTLGWTRIGCIIAGSVVETSGKIYYIAKENDQRSII